MATAKFMRSGSIVCPLCERAEVLPGHPSLGHCPACGYLPARDVVQILREITALPDALGRHACECGHPEMRLLPGGIFRCPACGSEVLPAKAP